MPERLRVLISAYACEPDKGSEPEVGWQTARHVAAHHDVTVLTRANNRAAIEAGLARHPGPHLEFIYYDLPRWALLLKRAGLPVAVYYFFWQIGARLHMRRRLAEFAVVHHATFNSFRHPGLWWGTGFAAVLGPLGGGQICPWRFLPWFRWQIFAEFLRSTSVINSFIFPHIYLSFLYARRLLIVNEDTARCVPWLFREKIVRLLETAVLPSQIVEERPRRAPGPVRFLWVSRLDKLKGGELAIEAFAAARRKDPNIRLTLAGGGREERPMRRLIARLGLDDAIDWRGRLPRAAVDEAMLEHDVFVFTSLRDTSGNVLLEAMAAGMATITFDHHGAHEMTTPETSLRVPVGTHEETIHALAEAMVALAGDAPCRAALGTAGRERVRAHYTWPAHAARLATIFREAAAEHRVQRVLRRRTLHPLFTARGAALIAAVFALVAVLLVAVLRPMEDRAREVAQQRLPGLVQAAAANSSFSDSFFLAERVVLESRADTRLRLKEELLASATETSAHMESYARLIASPEDRAFYEQFVEARTRYREKRTQAIELAEAGRAAEARQHFEAVVMPAFAQCKDLSDTLLAYNTRASEEAARDIIRKSTITRFGLLALALAVFVVGFILGLPK